MTALLPCPFCGGESDLIPECLRPAGVDPAVFCDGCHASANDAAAWNRRAPSPAGYVVVSQTVELKNFGQRSDEWLRGFEAGTAAVYATAAQEIPDEG